MKKGDINGIDIFAINLTNFQKYNKELKFEHIYLFEKILVQLHLNNKTFFTFPHLRIAAELRIGRRKVENIFKYYEDLGFIKKVNNSQAESNRYQVFPRIILENLDKIYNYQRLKNKSDIENAKNRHVKYFTEFFKGSLEISKAPSNIRNGQFPMVKP